MAGMKFEYDENGGKFYYFLLSFCAMILVPATYYWWPEKKEKKGQSQKHPEDTSTYGPCRVKYQLLNANEPYKRKKQQIIKIVLICAWILFALMAYRVSQVEIEHKEYDPYIVLNIDRGATDKEVRKQYRELSKTMHPDKGGDPEQFKELIKAYKSLTDDETKRNWELYGNPDGPGVTHFGIALPKWMVDDKNKMVVLGVYLLVFMVIMPVVVGLWWYKSIKYTSDKIFIITAQMYWAFLMRTVIIIPKRAIMILAASLEFDRNHNPEIVERPSDNIEIPQLMKNLPNLQEKNRELPLCCPYSVKARALIHAHLSRMDLPECTLVKDRNTIINKCPYLINEMVSIIAQIVGYTHMKGQHQPRLDTMENVMRMSPMIVQAIWDTKHCLLQLPHIQENHLRHFVTKKRNISTVKQFVAAKDVDRRSILRHLTDEQYDDIMRVCETYPHIEMKVKCGVFDDEDEHTLTVGAIVTLTVTLVRHNLRVLFDKEAYDEDKLLTEIEANLNNNEQQQQQNESCNNDGTDELLCAVAKPQANDDSVKQTKQPAKPWEKQKKKPKHLKAKANKPKQNQKSKKTTKIEDLGSAAVQQQQQQQQKTTVDKSESDDENDDMHDNNSVDNSESDNNENEAKIVNETTNVRESTTNEAKDEEFFEKFQQQQKKRENLEPKKRISHRVFCPHFPSLKQECWWLYVCDRKSRSLISAPVYICNLKDKDEFEIKFTAPQKVGIYSYSVMLRSDSYLDFDIFETVKLDIKPAVQIEDHPQWNIDDDVNESSGQKSHDNNNNNNDDNDNDNEYATESDDE